MNLVATCRFYWTKIRDGKSYKFNCNKCSLTMSNFFFKGFDFFFFFARCKRDLVQFTMSRYILLLSAIYNSIYGDHHCGDTDCWHYVLNVTRRITAFLWNIAAKCCSITSEPSASISLSCTNQLLELTTTSQVSVQGWSKNLKCQSDNSYRL